MIYDLLWPSSWLSFDTSDERETDRKQHVDLVEKREKVLVSAACGEPVTRENSRISVNGSHSHTFFNPHGIVYEIGCFETAPGCRDTSPSSSEFSWFPGYRWRVCGCRRCQAHLGWHFIADGGGFHGLILARLAEGRK